MSIDYPIQEGVSLDTLPSICIKSWADNDENTIRVQRKIVCAANRFELTSGGSLVIPASRHYSPIMRGLSKRLAQAKMIKTMMVCGDDQGFIDQFDDYHTREDALVIVKHSGQTFHPDRNGTGKELFSEGLY